MLQVALNAACFTPQLEFGLYTSVWMGFDDFICLQEHPSYKVSKGFCSSCAVVGSQSTVDCSLTYTHTAQSQGPLQGRAALRVNGLPMYKASTRTAALSCPRLTGSSTAREMARRTTPAAILPLSTWPACVRGTQHPSSWTHRSKITASDAFGPRCWAANSTCAKSPKSTLTSPCPPAMGYGHHSGRTPTIGQEVDSQERWTGWRAATVSGLRAAAMAICCLRTFFSLEYAHLSAPKPTNNRQEPSNKLDWLQRRHQLPPGGARTQPQQLSCSLSSTTMAP